MASPDGASSVKNLIAKGVLYLLALRAALESLYDVYFVFTDKPVLRLAYVLFALLFATIASACFGWAQTLTNHNNL